LYQVDPLRDPRWNELLARHPAASVFHTPQWLEALRRTYGYEPFVLTASSPRQELAEGFAVCRVNSWLTGRRLVSLPFSDHCEPLVNGSQDFARLLAELKQEAARNKRKYVELRPLNLLPGQESGLETSESFCLHKLDLSPTAAELFSGFHKDCIQRKVHRAEREGLTCEEGRSPALLRKFYDLLVITRRRQELAPQPLAWFQNLVDCMGENSQVRVVSKGAQPVASMLTLRFRRAMVYKYGCSDKAFSNLGGMPLLFWKAVQEAKSEGLLELDLGRSDWDNEGLVQFKDRLGAKRTAISYWRYPALSAAPARAGWKMSMAKRIFSHLPDAWLTTTGSLLYRHIG
jgi:hypothetical protein